MLPKHQKAVVATVWLRQPLGVPFAMVVAMQCHDINRKPHTYLPQPRGRQASRPIHLAAKPANVNVSGSAAKTCLSRICASHVNSSCSQGKRKLQIKRRANKREISWAGQLTLRDHVKGGAACCLRCLPSAIMGGWRSMEHQAWGWNLEREGDAHRTHTRLVWFLRQRMLQLLGPDSCSTASS